MTREEAINTVRNIYQTDKEKEALETLIPELTESEDERIRQKLIRNVSILAYHSGLEVVELSAWLEKKEQKPVELELKIPDWVHGGWDDEYMINTVIGRYSLHAEVAKKRGDTHDYNLSKSMENWLRNVVKPLIVEKQKEQKPVDYLSKDKVYAIMTKLNNLSFSTRIPINSDEYKELGEITTDVRSLLDYPIEQKPQWTEEDEKMLDRIIRHHEKEFEDLCNDKYGHQEIISDLKESCRERMDWLKSLPEKFGKPAEPELGSEECPINPVDQHFLKGKEIGREEILRDLPRWKRAKRGESLHQDSIIKNPDDDPRLGKVAVNDCLYIPVADLEKLPKEEEK